MRSVTVTEEQILLAASGSGETNRGTKLGEFVVDGQEANAGAPRLRPIGSGVLGHLQRSGRVADGYAAHCD